MGKQLTTEEFISKATLVHGDKYDYTDTVYNGAGNKVSILCPIHGSFEQYPNNHKNGAGCPVCVSEILAERYRKTNEEFIAEAKQVHGNAYDYSTTKYVGAREKVSIICSVHGEFLQTAGDHLAGKGCKRCACKASAIKVMAAKKVTTEDFIERANKLHDHKYDYKYANVDGTANKITIICPIHGKFKQTANKHLLGHGCQKCAHAAIKNGWTTTEWSTQAEQSKNFDGYKMYVVKLYDSEESFYKIGKTFRPVHLRFKDIKSMYNYEVIQVIEGDADTISKLERKYQQINKDNKYTPKVAFCGSTECFSKVNIKGITYGDD